MTLKLPLTLTSCKFCSVHLTTYSQAPFFIYKAFVPEEYLGINGKKEKCPFNIYLPSDYAPSQWSSLQKKAFPILFLIQTLGSLAWLKFL